MCRQLGMWMGGWVLGGIALAGCARVAFAQKAPPAPPVRVKQFPKPTSRPPIPKIVHLAPGQKAITPEQLRKAPTVYAANQRGAKHAAGSDMRPGRLVIPGAPQIVRDLPENPVKSPSPKPVSRPRAPKTTKRK